MKNRSLKEIAVEIREDWVNPSINAVPYLNAMSTLNEITDNYHFDSGEMIVAYFLSNARTWKGETARRVKKELNSMLN